MGYFTKFNMVLPLKNETPENIKEILIDLIENGGERISNNLIETPNHELFNGDHFLGFALCCSFYFTNTCNSEIRTTKTFDKDYPERLVIHIDSDFKNYNNEIGCFLDFIKDYLYIDEYEDIPLFLGYSRNEDSITPKLYYLYKGKIVINEVNIELPESLE